MSDQSRSKRASHRLRILHISDLHLRGPREHDRPRLMRVLGKAWLDNLAELRQHGAFDLVTFTGDVAFGGALDEYLELMQRKRGDGTVVRWLDETLAAAGCTRADLYVVPGNHDIARSIHAEAWSTIREEWAKAGDGDAFAAWLVRGRKPPRAMDPSLRDRLFMRQAAYRAWIEHGIDRRELLGDSRRSALGYRVTPQIVRLPFPVHVIGLDSAWLAGDDHDARKLRLTDEQILGLCTNEEGEHLGGLRIALVHHPLADLADGERSRRLLWEHGIDLLLSGHLHEPEAREIVTPDGRLRDLATGCLYQHDRYPNAVTALTLELDEAGRIQQVEFHFRSWSDRAGWHDDNGLYRGTHNGRLEWFVPDRATAAAPHIRAALDSHRRATAQVYEAFRWARRPIPLQVTDHARGETRDARDALIDWVRGPTQHCQVLGDFGAGKTGLLVWLASSLASDLDDGLVLLVPASRLTSSIAGFADLAAAAEPPFTAKAPGVQAYGRCYLLLDGLDELVGTLHAGIPRAKEALDAALAVVSESTRVVISCRTPAYTLIQDELAHRLARVAGKTSPFFAADRAIAEALGHAATSVSTYTVLPVRADDARASLHEELPPTANAFLERPFTLTLLQAALPQIRGPRQLGIEELYEKAVNALLRRDQPSLDNAEIEASISHLEELSAVRFLGRSTPEQQQALERARYTFDHYSYWEFFFGRRLARQIASFDATILARLDLVAGYNINRLLVPILLRRISMRAASQGVARPVLAFEYTQFLDATGWRRSTGYGAHPSMLRSHDGTASTTFPITAIELDSIHARRSLSGQLAAGLSWYDVAAFALWRGAGMPTSSEATVLLGVSSNSFWCADWYAEPRAQLVTFDATTGELQGVNPDVRLPRIAAAIIDAHV